MSDAEQTRTRQRPETSDVVGTVILGVVGLTAVVMGLDYGFTVESGQVGPGFLPVLTGGFIVLATILELLRMFFAKSSPVEGSFMGQVEHVEGEARAAIARTHGADAGEEAAEELDTFGRSHRQRSAAIVQIFLVMLVALLLIPVLGLLISFSAMALTLLLYVERKPVLPSALATGAALAFFYFIFVQGLRVPLPTGMLGII